MATKKANIEIRKGETYTNTLRWEAPPYLYRPITAILQSAPIRITAPVHGLLQGWRVAIESVKGTVQANTKDVNNLDAWPRVTVIDADTVELNEINSLEYSPYISGGVIKFNTPVDLAGFTARMSIRDKLDGVEIILLTTANGRIIIDNATKSIALAIPADVTAAVTQKKGVYDIELISSGGLVYRLAEGSVSFSKEVTT